MKPAIIVGVVVIFVIVVGAGYFFIASRGPQPSVGDEWQKEGVIFSTTSYYNPEVVRLDNGSWRMYFENYGWIYSAISTDGRSWTIEDGARIQGVMPAVIRLPDGRWRLYYEFIPTGPDGGTPYIASAVSSDGLSFEQESGSRIVLGGSGSYDSAGVRHPTIIRLENDAYRMYYDGEAPDPNNPGETITRILSAYSADGLT